MANTEHKAPGKAFREGLTILEMFRLFPDDAAAEQWFEAQRWGETGRCCPDCGSCHTVEVKNRRPMPYRCKDCRHHFSVKKGTVMQGSRIGYQKWLFAIYMMVTGLKGTSSMKIHRELGITQKTAWYLMQRIREGFLGDGPCQPLDGPVEADETFVGGKRKNMPLSKRKKLEGRGTAGKKAVVGVKDRKTKKVRAKVVENTDALTLQGFVRRNVRQGSTVYTDEARAYTGLQRDYEHDSVAHGVGEYVKDIDVHTNGIESLWSMFKRGYVGTYHRMSFKHLHRYVNEFAGRHNIRDLDTLEQMAMVTVGMDQKRLRYQDLIA